MHKKSITLVSCVALAAGIWIANPPQPKEFNSPLGKTQITPSGKLPSKNSGNISKIIPTSNNGPSTYFDAPDNGTLVTYEKNAPTKEGPFDLYPARISESYALRATIDGEMTILAPDGTRLKMDYVRHIEGKNGNWTWVGRLPGAQIGEESIVTFGKNSVFGSLGSSGGKVYRISTVNGKPYVMAATQVQLQAATPREGLNNEA